MHNPLFEHLRDLHLHMAWADAVWFQTWAKAGCQDDEDLLQRTQHSIDTQAAFLTVLRGEELVFPKDRPLPDFPGLLARARANHEAFDAYFRALDPGQLNDRVHLPWFPGVPCRVTVAEALTQVAMHTQHHRGQFMTRLKALGGKPQNVDYIIWAWKERPVGRWE